AKPTPKKYRRRWQRSAKVDGQPSRSEKDVQSLTPFHVDSIADFIFGHSWSRRSLRTENCRPNSDFGRLEVLSNRLVLFFKCSLGYNLGH
ncbi:unnamed protein product, partial [Ixodes pacificus]